MSVSARSLVEISKTVRGAFRQYLTGTDASLLQNVIYVIGKVITLLVESYEQRLVLIYKQLFLTTATWEAIIRLHCAEYGIFRKPASSASGLISGTGAPNETYPAGIRYVSGATTYVTTAPFTANAIGDFTATVRSEQTGAATNRNEDAILNLADPILHPDLSGEAAVGQGGIGGGADMEDMDSLKARGMQRKAAPPQGGALADYERWAREVPGVIAAWAANMANATGSIGVWVLFEGRVNGIPTQADAAAVDAYIVDKRIVRGQYYTLIATARPVDIRLSLSPDTLAQRAAVTDALTRFFDATRPDTRLRPGLPGNPFILPRAWVSEVISTTPGEHSHQLLGPAIDVGFQPGDLPVLGTIEFD